MDNRNLWIDHLGDVLAFVRVAEARSFTAAAERMGMSRSAVGKCVARLEANLAVRLVQRTTRSVALSDEGQLFYEHALRILSEVESAETAMARRAEAPRGRLRLDLPVSFGRLHIVPILHRFLEKWPDVEADVTFSDEYRDLVRDGIDLAIRIGGENDSRLMRRKLAPHRLITCGSPAYLAAHGAPETPDDLIRYRKVVFIHGGLPTPWRYTINGADRATPVEGRLRFGDTEALRDAALAGAGLVQIGAFLVGDELQTGKLVSVLERFSAALPPVCAVYPHRRHLSPKVRCFVDEIRQTWAAKVPWD